ncbi:MAG: transcriptional repressor [Actinobacteria bacterium ATB1]|nr:transcriptional repressor [Actinobacteria bacterium ATB1]
MSERDRRREGSADVLREVKRRLAEADQRMTRGRRVLVEAFLGVDSPQSVPELLEAVTDRVPQSSLYRNLAVLCDVGVVRRLNFDEGFVRYELDHDITEHHHHLVCSNCNSVVDLDERTLEKVEAALARAEVAILRSRGFAVEEHQLDLRGVCAECR